MLAEYGKHEGWRGGRYINYEIFERLAADILNALGYQAVEPMAPRGGQDGGRDIRFKEGEAVGIAFVIEKKINSKFERDLAKEAWHYSAFLQCRY